MGRTAFNSFARNPSDLTDSRYDAVVWLIEVSSGSQNVQSCNSLLQCPRGPRNFLSLGYRPSAKPSQLVQIWRHPIHQRKQSFLQKHHTFVVEQFPPRARLEYWIQ